MIKSPHRAIPLNAAIAPWSGWSLLIVYLLDLTLSFLLVHFLRLYLPSLRSYGTLKGVKILGIFQFSKIYRPKTNGPIGLKFGRLIERVQAQGSTNFGTSKPGGLSVGEGQMGTPAKLGSLTEGTHHRPKWFYVLGSTQDLSGVSVYDNGT